VLALIYLQAWSVLLCKHIYIKMLQGVNTAYGVKGCVSNTVCVIIVMHVVTWFYANSDGKKHFIRHIFTCDVQTNARYVVVGLILQATKGLPWVSLAMFGIL